jgi:hypothetical protein
MGPLKLEKLIQETNWWYRLRADCENLCRQCANCALASADFKVEKIRLNPVKVEKGIGRSWAIDLAFGLPKTKKGNNGFIIAVERLSRWIEVRAIKDKSSTTVTRFIYEDIIARHGVPKNINSDQVVNFLTKFNFC